jgi:hypothetical protein
MFVREDDEGKELMSEGKEREKERKNEEERVAWKS